MKRFILLAFIGALLIKNVTSSVIQAYPSNLAWLFGLNNKLNENKEVTQNVCKNQECEKIAKVISESMDKSLDPCDDFYEYACSKWPEHNPIPKGSRSWSLFHMLQANVERQVNDILEEGPKSSDILAVKLAKKWYAVCINTDAMDKQGLDPLVTTISRIGGWPMIMDPDEWDEHEYSWQKVDDQYVRLTGKNAFHDVRLNIYSPNKTVKISLPHLPSGTYKLLFGEFDDSDEIEEDDDEDPSDEQDNPESGSEDDNSKNDDDDNDDNGDDDNDDNDDDDNDDYDDDDNDDNNDTNEQSEKKEVKKKINKRKSTGKFNHKRNTKIQHNKKTKRPTRILEKHDSHKMKKQRVKRRAISTKVHSKLVQHLTHREKLRKKKINHVRKVQDEEETKETLETVSTTPQTTIEETSDEGVETARQVYANYISQVARAIAKARDTEVPEEHIDKDIEDMIQFQLKLGEIVLDSDEEDLELTLNDFQKWYDKRKSKSTNSKIDWVYKVTELFDEAHVPVDGDLSINVDPSDYFKALASLLDETSKRTIVNYIHWNFLNRMIETTTSEMRKLYFSWEEWEEWEDEEDGEDEEESEEENEEERRSSICKRKVQLHDILAYEYVKRHFSDDITKTAEDMVDDIQKEVEYQIKESDWLDEDTKDYVFSKLVNMKKYIGYPDWFRNNTIVKRYFQGLIISNSYYENVLSYSRYSKWKQLRELKKKDDDEDDDDIWWMSPLTVNAFFSPWANSISLSAADFQSPFFAYGRPQAINYGIVGVIMAHEVNHGFDDDGIKFDKNGDFVEWLSIMAQEYSKRANCFVEQFNNYEIEKNSNKKITNYGNQTSGENIADTMGLQAAFRAYQRRERECGKPDTVLPGLEEITHDQLYFLSFANVWCEATIDSETTERHAKMDVHSTGRLRVIGSVSNSEDFAKAFNCPVGSAMNPEKKCNIWK